MGVNNFQEKLRKENAIKMSTIAPNANIPGILNSLLQKYINASNVPNYLEEQKNVVNAQLTAGNFELIAGDLLKSEMSMSGSDLRLREIIGLMSISLPVNEDRFSLETTYIEMLQNLNKAQLKEYGPASKLGLQDIENTLAGLEGIQQSSAYSQDLMQQIEGMIYPLLTTMDPMTAQKWLNMIANIEYMIICTQILSDLARRSNELKPNIKSLRRDSNNQSGYQRPDWLKDFAGSSGNSSREKLMMLENIRNYIDQTVLSMNKFTGYNSSVMYDNLIDLSDDELRYLFSFTTNSQHLTAADAGIMKKLAIGTHISIYYDQYTGNLLADLPIQIKSMIGILSCAKSLEPNYAMQVFCTILGIQPIAYPTNPVYNPGSPYMLYFSLTVNNPNIFFGHLLIEDRSSDLFELSKRMMGCDGTSIPVFNINDLMFLQQQTTSDVGNMYKTPQGISQYLATKGVISSPQAFNEMSEIISSVVSSS